MIWRVESRVGRKTLLLTGLVLAVVIVAVTLLVVVPAWQRGANSDLEEALDRVPAASLRVSFTDWDAVREAVDVPASTSPDRAEELVRAAYDEDWSAGSTLTEGAAALQQQLGFSPTSITWEAFAQSRQGAALVLKMPDDTDFDAIERKLEDAGYTPPEGDSEVFVGGSDVLVDIDTTITPEVNHVAVLPDEGLLVTSDNARYAEKAVAAATGEADTLGSKDATQALLDPLESPAVSAMLWADDFACEDLAMSQAAEEDQQRAEELVDKAGGVSPLSGLLMAMGSNRSIDVVELFEDGDQARDNLEPRARLAVGEAAGRGESFADRFELRTSRTDGDAVVLQLGPKGKTGFALSAINNGPVLFATC